MGINDFHKRLASLHFWNALLVMLLALSGLVMFSGYWREILGEARTGIKWLHVILGLVLIVPVIYYMPHVTRHWKQLEGKVCCRDRQVQLSIFPYVRRQNILPLFFFSKARQ